MSTFLLHGERNPGIPVAPQEEVVSTLHSRGTPGVVPPFHKTPMSQCTSDTTDSPALTRWSPRGPTPNTMAIVTALWHLERKPPIPMSTRQEAWHCFSSSIGELACMFPHGTRTDSPLETPEEHRGPCRPCRGTLSFRPKLQMRTSALAVTAEESREAPHNLHGDWTSLRPHERVP